MRACKDEIQELMHDCKASFIVTDIDHVESVQFAVSSTSNSTHSGSTHFATDLNVRYVVSM